MTDLAKNKTTVTAFYDPMFNQCRPAEAIEKYVGGVYIQHNPAVGTAASLTGIAAVLRKHQPGIKIGAVEPAGSPVLPGGSPGPHKIEGVGIDFTPSLWESGVADMIVPGETDSLFFAERSQA